uniref:Lysozyme n=1 Tax=Panagrolaimus sp. ES5 TaxID=591445 RepID=A0AC34GY83_9BILA
MAALKTLIVCLVLIAALVDSTQVFANSARRGPKIVQNLKNVKEETNAQLPRHFNRIFPAPPLNPSAKAAYNFAVDVSAYGSASTFACIYKQGYEAVFIQAYSPSGGGSLNPNLIQNLNNAATANLGTEIFVTPYPGKSGSTQFDTVFNALKNSGINVRSIWLQVTSPVNWSNNMQININVIQDFIGRANSNGVSAGVYTNWYEWQQITGSITTFSNLRLWYWNYSGPGSNGESNANFNDFTGFAGWTQPAAKQFASNESLCGMTLNRNVYPAGSKAVKQENKNVDKKLTVGGFV